MCGITGIYSYGPNTPPVDPGELDSIGDSMRKRGPDDKGKWYTADHSLGLTHRRLSIIDLSDDAAQPMVSADGRYVIIFNGEIYNYSDLRQQLELKGCRFRTNSDTEVIQHLFAEKGTAMLPELRGMFALALWDNERKRLLLARDPYGIKPLYYADNGNTLRLASQVKALLSGGAIALDQDPAGLVGFYLFGSVPEPFTLYREIRSVPAGSYITVSQSGVSKPTVWFSIAEKFCNTEEPARKLEQDHPSQLLRCHLLDSVKYHLEADVPVGAFLSAGIDSGVLVGLMAELCRTKKASITTVTLGFDEFKGSHGDEAPLAAKVAEYYGTKHVIRRISKTEFLQELPLFFDAMDQPSIDGLNTWFVSKAAHELGLKVAVSGLGGDELFGGYPSFQDIPRWVRTFALPSRCPYLGDAFRYLFSELNPFGFNPKTAGLLKYGGDYPGAYLLKRGLFMPWELPRLLDRELVREGMNALQPLGILQQVLQCVSDTPYHNVAALESCFYMRNQLLRDADWAGMAHSLEIRVPLVDTFLLRNVAPLLDGSDGKMWKKLLGTAPKPPLPNEILYRKKTGFGLPMATWIKDCTTANSAKSSLGTKTQDVPWARKWAPQVLHNYLASNRP